MHQLIVVELDIPRERGDEVLKSSSHIFLAIIYKRKGELIWQKMQKN